MSVPTFGHIDGPASDDQLDPDHPSAKQREPLEPVPDLDDLETLAGDLATAVVATTKLEVETRPGYLAEYRLDFTGRDLDGWRKQSRDRKATDGLDAIKLGALILAWTNVAIYKGGRKLTDDGEPLTFRDEALQDLLGAAGARPAVVRFYGLEGELDKHARGVLEAAGWGADAMTADADPTPGR